MREILFRGKKFIGNEWIYGDLSYIVQDGRIYVFPEDGYDSPDFYEVDPDTVGEYTSLKDKNGRKIFEGDIVKDSDNDIFEVKFEDGNFLAIPFCGIDDTLLSCINDTSKIIGNIFDGQELYRRA